MTWNEMVKSKEPTVSVYDVAEVLGCSPQRLRDALDIDDQRPVDMRRFPFPHCKVGASRKICRIGFIRWMNGDLSPAAVIFKRKDDNSAAAPFRDG